MWNVKIRTQNLSQTASRSIISAHFSAIAYTAACGCDAGATGITLASATRTFCTPYTCSDALTTPSLPFASTRGAMRHVLV